MDQAMGDLQNQLEEVKRMWEEERNARQRLEIELESLRSSAANGVASALPSTAQTANLKSSDSGLIDPATRNKRRSEEIGDQTNGATVNGDGDRDGKRQRTD